MNTSTTPQREYFVGAKEETSFCPDTSCHSIVNTASADENVKLKKGYNYIGFCSRCKAHIFQKIE